MSYISETDAALGLFLERGEGSIDDLVDRIVAGRTIDVEEFDEFFLRLTTPRAWHTSRENERARRFARLKQLLEENLSSLHVYKIGRIRRRILIIGLDRDGLYMGVQTEAVET